MVFGVNWGKNKFQLFVFIYYKKLIIRYL